MSWIAGVALSIVGNVIINLGTNIVKIAHERRKALRAERLQKGEAKPSAKDLIKDKYWAGGTFLFIMGNLLNFASFGFAAQTLLASLSSIQFVTNIFFARMFFNEKLTKRIFLGTALIIAGNTLVVIFTSGDVKTQTITNSVLGEDFTQASFLIYLFLAFAIAGSLQAYFHFWVTPRLRKHFELQIKECEAIVSKQMLDDQNRNAIVKVGSRQMMKVSSQDSDYRLEKADTSSSSERTNILNDPELVEEEKESNSQIEKAESNGKTTEEMYKNISIDPELKEQVTKNLADKMLNGNPDDTPSTHHHLKKISFSTLVQRASAWSNHAVKRRIERALPEDQKDLLTLQELRALPILYACQSAILGSFSVLLAKALSSLFKTTFSGDLQLDTAAFWIVLITWFVFMAFWLTRMNKSLKMFDGVIIIPTLQVFWIVFSIISGGLFYQELEQFDSGSLVGFVFSVLGILVGVVILTSRQKKPKPSQAAQSREGSEEFSKTTAAKELEKIKSDVDEKSVMSLEGSRLILKDLEKEMEKDEMSLLRKVSLVPHVDYNDEEGDSRPSEQDPEPASIPSPVVQQQSQDDLESAA